MASLMKDEAAATCSSGERCECARNASFSCRFPSPDLLVDVHSLAELTSCPQFGFDTGSSGSLTTMDSCASFPSFSFPFFSAPTQAPPRRLSTNYSSTHSLL
jgi:hypothetical protein